jgi:hypothetical protein
LGVAGAHGGDGLIRRLRHLGDQGAEGVEGIFGTIGSHRIRRSGLGKGRSSPLCGGSALSESKEAARGRLFSPF